MRFLFKFILVVFIGVLIGLAAIDDPGYVLINRAPWVVETSLTFFILLLLISFLVLYYLIRFIVGSREISQHWQQWQQHRRKRRGIRALTRGLVKLAERQWHAAEKELTRFAEDSEAPLLNYLAAASAAQGQAAHDRRDHYLYLAHQSMPEADLAVGLTQAELQLGHQQMEQALATLTHLQTLDPRHTHVLKLLMQLYLDLKDWRHLRDLLPTLRRRHVIDSNEYRQLERRVHLALLKSAVASNVHEVVLDVWNQVPRQQRHDTDLLLVYVNYLISHADAAQAEKLLRDALHVQWDDRLLELYGRIDADAPAKQLSHAERWLVGRETDPVLLLTLGRISMRNQLWGKARSYLETSISSRAMPATYQALGDLLTQMDEAASATDYYQKGLKLALRQSA
jgi:HemY protein